MRANLMMGKRQGFRWMRKPWWRTPIIMAKLGGNIKWTSGSESMYAVFRHWQVWMVRCRQDIEFTLLMIFLHFWLLTDRFRGV